jgi:hypothetical protein
VVLAQVAEDLHHHPAVDLELAADFLHQRGIRHRDAARGRVAGCASATTTPTPVPAAGPLSIRLICDTGPRGTGTFTVTANSKSSTVSVKCGGSATVTNAAWKAGSPATIHQTAATASGQLRAADVKVTLMATAQTVSIRNFRAASTAATTATLAQTGGGLPILPIGGALG